MHPPPGISRKSVLFSYLIDVAPHRRPQTVDESASEELMSGLPLRLWANPHVERYGANGRGFCLDVLGGDHVEAAAAVGGTTALALDGRGVALVVCEDDPESRRGLASKVQSVGERLFGAEAWASGPSGGGSTTQGVMPMTVLARMSCGDPRWYRITRGGDDGGASVITLSLLMQNDVRRHLAENVRPPATKSMAAVVVGSTGRKRCAVVT